MPSHAAGSFALQTFEIEFLDTCERIDFEEASIGMTEFADPCAEAAEMTERTTLALLRSLDSTLINFLEASPALCIDHGARLVRLLSEARKFTALLIQNGQFESGNADDIRQGLGKLLEKIVLFTAPVSILSEAGSDLASNDWLEIKKVGSELLLQVIELNKLTGIGQGELILTSMGRLK